MIDPPLRLAKDNEDKMKFCLFGALVLEMIWKCKNQVVHEGRVFYVKIL